MQSRYFWPYVLPFLIFAVFLSVEGWFPDEHYLIYPWKTVVVGAVILWQWRQLPSLRPGSPLISALVGVIGVVIWVGLDPILVHYPAPLIGRNPFLLYGASEAWVLFGFRLLGMAVVVPIMEELFWRGYLMRWLIKEDFTEVPLGTYTPVSFFVTTAFFASVHGAEWPLAVIVGLLYGGWFVKTKKLGDVMVAHGVTNLLLGLYCLRTNDWHFLSIAAHGHV
jgi:CAAX prenyl protease-like protein